MPTESSERPASLDDLPSAATALPGVSVEDGHAGPVYKVGTKTFAFHREPRADAVDEKGERLEDVICLWVGSEADKQALVQDPSSPWFTTPHFDGHLSVLVRQSQLGELCADELVEVVEEAWLARATKKAAAAQLAARETGRATAP